MSTQPPHDVVVARYASPEMSALFSPERRVRLWRELWIALAEAEKELGLPITAAQIAEMRRFKDKINWSEAAKIEREIRHDVMAHVHAYGKQCRKAAGIIHLGATSMYVADNADAILMREGLNVIAGKLASAIDRLADFAARERATATVGFTHFQAAQPTTVGKRACLWLYNFVMDLERLEFERERVLSLGVKGTTGTQDSFLKLFDGDKRKVVELDRRVSKKMGFKTTYPVTGQTYPRKVDTRILSLLADICESASKFAVDVRLLQGLHEVEEPREAKQVGSSAMPYKQNPMRAERIGGLARYVIHLLGNGYETAANQWFERTLDDSSNRRIVLPHAFQVTDGVLDLVINVAASLRVNGEVIQKNLERELPLLQTEEILMAAVRAGGNRQELHERLRKHSWDVVRQIREKGGVNDLLARLRKDPKFARISPKLMVKANPNDFVGLAPEQVDAFLTEVVQPLLKRYRAKRTPRVKLRV